MCSRRWSAYIPSPHARYRSICLNFTGGINSLMMTLSRAFSLKKVSNTLNVYWFESFSVTVKVMKFLKIVIKILRLAVTDCELVASSSLDQVTRVRISAMYGFFFPVCAFDVRS